MALKTQKIKIEPEVSEDKTHSNNMKEYSLAEILVLESLKNKYCNVEISRNGLKYIVTLSRMYPLELAGLLSLSNKIDMKDVIKKIGEHIISPKPADLIDNYTSVFELDSKDITIDEAINCLFTTEEIGDMYLAMTSSVTIDEAINDIKKK